MIHRRENFARQIGTSNATISRIINGDGDAMLKTVIAIADYFSVSLEWLVGRE